MNYRMVSVSIALAAVAMFTAPTNAALFISTDISGANIQCDINHTPYWTYSVTADVSGVDGGLFVMKSGPSTDEDITFTIFEGTFDQFNTATPLLTATLTPADFTNQYEPILFQSAPISLLASTTYTAVLASSAADPQNSAYFVKSGNLRFVDGNNEVVGDGPEIIPSPEPGTAALLAAPLVALFLNRRRKLA